MLHWSSFEIWKMITRVSWCNDFIWDARIFFGDLKHAHECAMIPHDALMPFGSLENAHKCVMLQWLFWGSEKSSLVRHHSLIFFWYPRNLHSCGALIGYGFRHWGFGILDFGGSRNVPLGNSVTAPRVQRLEWPCADFKWANSVL